MKDVKFPFSDAPNTACFTCRHVLEENRPIRYVSHDEDGYWQFLCGGNHTEEDARVVSLVSVWEMDESVGELVGLDYGESAEAADPADGWVIARKGKNMHQKQQDIAQNDMAQWLADPHELGKEPGRIECAGEFGLHGMRYYIFKFKTGVLSPWLVGVSGGYEGDSLTPCGHTFSEMKKYHAATAQGGVRGDGGKNPRLLDGAGGKIHTAVRISCLPHDMQEI